ncbi:hypothetical protein [Alkalinema sp. FACHB-956]|uniref:hypothetical protein n=1 Tax=Alkalinema sp. FACHB-956 TaxID=2692768 RepID=UPI0016856DA9|nr:hypothetical protein [Alkalinema sp. FACHB-956]MBD2329332.1 hypothetical protein [Alkalinema sp. FACHB-956]
MGLLLLSSGPSLAQSSNFGSFELTSGSQSVSVTGSTGGTTSLPAITSDVDRDRNKCLGFGDPKPDHVMTLKQGFSQLTLKVESGQDTTLIIVGPGGVTRCGDDTGNKKDASITDSDWAAGTYQIWVGSMEPGMRSNYRLSVQGK